MNILKRSLLLFILPLMFASCETSQGPINDLSSLLERIDNDSESYTEEDWDNIAMEYTRIEEELSRYEYSDEELREIGKLKGKILAKLTKKAVKDFSKQVEDFSKQLDGGIEGFFEDFSNEEVE